MKAVIQRVRDASVRVAGELTGRIDRGLLVYLGVARGDGPEDARRLAEKIVVLRIFEDGEGKMNLSVQDTGGSVLTVSQFTLLADARKGRRPFYGEAADPDTAREFYDFFIEQIRKTGIPCESGVFQAHMDVAYVNDGPVTIILDSRDLTG
jgi:D-tyrosyl-tRNA(Tyr) deacylase